MSGSSEPQVRRGFPGPGQAVGLVLALLGVQLAGGMVVALGLEVLALAGERGGAAPEMPLAAMLAVNVLAFAVVGGWALSKTRGQWCEILMGGLAGGASWLAALPMLLGTTLLVAECSAGLRMVLPLSASMLQTLQTATDLVAQPVLAVLLVAVVAPIAEEFLFRGIILRGLLGRLRPWGAIGLTTFLFAAMHMNPWQVPAGLGLGWLCGYVYLRTRSLTLCILLHFLNNAGALFASRLPWVVTGLNDEEGRAELLPWWLVVAALAALGFGWYCFRRTTEETMQSTSPLLAVELDSAAVDESDTPPAA
jgi:membrane protease YdiL (CAAX protease family)